MSNPTPEQSQPDPSSAVPAVIFEDAPDDEYGYDEEDGGDEGQGVGGRRTINLDDPPAGASGRARAPFDLSALIGQVERQRSRAAAPPPPATAPAPPRPTQPAPVVASPAVGAGAVGGAPAAPEQNGSEGDPAELRRLRQELETERNNVRRGAADLVNARRKAEQDRDRAVREASERSIKQLLPIMDDFERGLAGTARAQSYEQLATGVQAVLRNFEAMLAKQGVEQVPTVGEMFDPDIHEAVAVRETTDQPDDVVLEELRRGYRYNGRLLRAAMVRVARRVAPPDEGSAAAAEPDAAAEEANAGAGERADATAQLPEIDAA